VSYIHSAHKNSTFYLDKEIIAIYGGSVWFRVIFASLTSFDEAEISFLFVEESTYVQ